MFVQYKTVSINGINIFYREAGNTSNPTILLLHGFPSSSHMYRNLINKLMGEYHVIAPDYPGFGNSDQPVMTEFEYTFDNLTLLINKFVEKLQLEKFSLYIQDYGAPVGLRLAAKHPE
ncbi:alpha/beta fold hydrolase [Domibacillus sp. PGB-M46]|uniref:alpha/beta fold hydrolase n=1 Tax=Domibacillus sp. PGB-M46 TaxID=2910255 RepID=UPI00281606FC|nr:alpha/beta fold hydrolase [Domibacillus sp. PGB-M46]